jgi:hypothetical protein
MGIGLVLGIPRRSIQHERIYLTPAFSSFTLASLSAFYLEALLTLMLDICLPLLTPFEV